MDCVEKKTSPQATWILSPVHGYRARSKNASQWLLERTSATITPAPVPSHALNDGFSVAFLRLWNLERHGNEANPILALLLADSHRLMAEEALQLKQVVQVVLI